MGFKGNIIKAKRTLPTKEKASGVWKVEDVAEANQRGEWPGKVKRDPHRANTTFMIKAENTDGGNNDNLSGDAFLNVSDHNAGTGYLENQGPSAKDTYTFRYFNQGLRQANNIASHENPFEKDGYYSWHFFNENFRSMIVPNIDKGFCQGDHYDFHWGSAEGTLEMFIRPNETGEIENTIQSAICGAFTNNYAQVNAEQSGWALWEDNNNAPRRISFALKEHNTNVLTPFLTSAVPHRGRGWVHVALTRDNRETDSRYRLFINGMLAATNTIAKNTNWGGYEANYAMSIGDSLLNQNSYYYKGYISNIRICKSVPSDYVTSASVVGTHCFDPPMDRLTPDSQGASSCAYLGLQSSLAKNNASGFTIGYEYKDGERVTASPTHEISNWQPLQDGIGHPWTGTYNNATKNPVADHANYGAECRNISPFHGGNKTFTFQLGSATGVANGTGFCIESEFGSVGTAFVSETITMYEGFKYSFDQQHATNFGNQIKFSITEDGTHGGGVEFTDFVSAEGTAGQSASFTSITIPSGFTTNIAPRLFYYSVGAANRGGKIQISPRYIPKSESHNYGSQFFPYHEEGGSFYQFGSGMDSGLYDTEVTKAFMFSAREAFCFEGWWKFERNTGVGIRATMGFFGAYNVTNPNSHQFVFRMHELTGNPNVAIMAGDTANYRFNQDLWVSNNLQHTAPITLGGWNHIAVCRTKPPVNTSAAVYGIFINGKNVNSTQATVQANGNNFMHATYNKHGFAFGTPNNNAVPGAGGLPPRLARRGRFPNSDGNAFMNNVHVSNFRYVRGHSVYNVSADQIYLPSSPFTTYQGLNSAMATTQTTADGTSTVVLTFQNKNETRQRGLLDKSPQQRRVRTHPGNANLQCGTGRFTPFIKPFGYWSGYFRQNSYLDITKESTSTVFNGTNADDTFTLEAFIMNTAPSISTSGTDDQFNYIFVKGLGTNIGKGLGVTTDGKLRFIYYDDTSTQHVIVESAAGKIKFGPWYHVAVSNASGSGNLKLFIDGVEVASGTYGATATQNGEVPRIGMGNYGEAAYQGFTGYISNLRVSTSTRYTQGFSPIDKPFSDDANTTLLCLNNYRWTDSSSNNAIFDFPYGSPQVNPLSPFVPPVETYDPEIHGASWYLRNNHDSQTLFTPNNTKYWYVERQDVMLEPEMADYTMECWVYHEGNNYTTDSVVKGGRPFFNTNGTGGAVSATCLDVPENTVHPFTWNHLVIQKEQHSPATSTSGNHGTVARFSMYLNGNRVYESTTWPLRQYNDDVPLEFARNLGQAVSRVDLMHMGTGTGNRWAWCLDGSTYGGMRGYIFDIRYLKNKNTFPASKATYDVPTKPTKVDVNTQFHLNASGSALPNVTGTSNVRTVAQAQAANNVPAKFGSGCIYFTDNGSDHLSTPLDVNNCMERCSFTIEGFVKYEQLYRVVQNEPDYRGAIVGTAQQHQGLFHIINRGDAMQSTNNGLGVRLDITSSFMMSYNYQNATTFSTVAENTAGQPELAAGNSAGHTYNTIVAESDFGPLEDRPGHHRKDQTDSKAPWYHFALVRDATLASNNLVFYFDGKKKLFATDSSNYPVDMPFLKIGIHNNAAHTLVGWMDNFRVTKGIARYDVSQDTISVPTEDFPEF